MTRFWALVYGTGIAGCAVAAVLSAVCHVGEVTAEILGGSLTLAGCVIGGIIGTILDW